MTRFATYIKVALFLFVLFVAWRIYVFHSSGVRARSIDPFTGVVELDQVQVKTGDLVLFCNVETPALRRQFNNSYFTHVGMVYVDPSDQRCYILESHAEKQRTKQPFAERVRWYQEEHTSTEGEAGIVAVRPLNRALQAWQLQELERTLHESALPVVVTTEDHDFSTHELIRDVVMPYAWDCVMAHAFMMKVTDNKEGTRMFCTDYIVYLLQQMHVLRADINARCIVVDWLQGDGVNQSLAQPNEQWYADEIVGILPVPR